MSEDTATTRRRIKISSRGEANLRLLDVDEERLTRINASGVDTEVLRIARPRGQRRTGVRRRLNRSAAFATLPTSGNRASGHRPGTSGQCSSRTGETFLDHANFERVGDAPAHLGVPL
ncbi:hypothetical protein [Streptomyces niveus]|uniref:hypothetical protein n=1 Tax=Streptomyces niveus TaxID=193462 RepID=UPI003448E0DE